MAELKTKAKPVKLGQRRNKWTRDDTELTVLAVPTMVWYALFCYLPMFGIILAFKDYKIVDATKSFLYNLIQSDWAGFKNFQYFLSLKDFPMILRNTILYNVVFIVLDIVLPVGLAIMISNIYSKRKSKVYHTLMFMPHFMSWVVVSYFVYAFLDGDKGLLNNIIQHFGGDRIKWYTEPKYWPAILIIVYIWKTFGYNCILYYATLVGIDRDPQALADALVKIHSLNRAERQLAGEVGKKLAAPFSSEAWAERVMEMAKEIVGL